MTKKQTYTAPEADLLVIRFEEGFLTTSGNMSANGWTSGNSSWWEDEE